MLESGDGTVEERKIEQSFRVGIDKGTNDFYFLFFWIMVPMV